MKKVREVPLKSQQRIRKRIKKYADVYSCFL